MNTRRHVDNEVKRLEAKLQEVQEDLTALEYAVEGKHAAAVANRNAAAAARRNRACHAQPGHRETPATGLLISDRSTVEAAAAALRWRTRTLNSQGKLF